MRVTDLLRDGYLLGLPSEKQTFAQPCVSADWLNPRFSVARTTRRRHVHRRSGRIRLSTNDPSGNEKSTYFTDGQFFGETALLTGAPRSAA
jgi:hypothetical protein